MAVHRLDPALRPPHRKSMKPVPIILNQTLTHRGLPAAFNIHNDEMKGAMGMRLGNPLARNWFCRKANAANGMFGRHDISAITRLPSMSDLVADLW
jgi:hypothetical protein